MTTWNDYRELLGRVGALADQRDGPLPDAVRETMQGLQDLVDAAPDMAPELANQNPPHGNENTPICRLPDETVVRALGFSANSDVGAVATAACYLGRLVETHKLALFWSSAPGAAAITKASGLELARLERWTDDMARGRASHEATLLELPEDELPLDGLLCFVQIRRRKYGRRGPPAECLASHWFELDDSMVDDEGHLNLKLPAFTFPTPAELWLDITVYNPESDQAAVIYHGGENDDECYADPDDEESVVFEKFMSGKHVTVGWYGNTWNGLFEFDKHPLTHVRLEVDPLDPDSETEYISDGTIEIQFRWEICSRNINLSQEFPEDNFEQEQNFRRALFNLPWDGHCERLARLNRTFRVD